MPPIQGAETRAQSRDRKKEKKNEEERVEEVEGKEEEQVEKMDDCLLYTSPSPRDKRQSRMPSSA